ncbi:chemotaxis protein CheW [Photobacterium damselae]|uniref:chemotaxis protein CheW n=1 Tax=Photobacterium damselae TaxID=38293 RepID=UPI000D80DA22|nr:chemotaxis protein CheW [Photobacterium damselae]NVO76181.1 chemotaxis protein CheW [Photobacterium damselae subsp. damselae]SPY25045.1 CheW-like domain [Photobacterium damselae]
MANKPLSSEQALNDYFSDLLVEELWDEPSSEDFDSKSPESETLNFEDTDICDNAQDITADSESTHLASKEKWLDTDTLIKCSRSQIHIEPKYAEPILTESVFAEPILAEPVSESQLQLQQLLDTWSLQQDEHWVSLADVHSEPAIELTIEPAIEPELEENSDALVVSIVEPEILADFSDSSAEPIAETLPILERDDALFADVETEHQALVLEASTPINEWQGQFTSSSFQALFFEVNGVMFAVALEQLGGIHRLGELNHLLGRPKWYLGLQSSPSLQLDVVDTARWVMSDKLRNDDYLENYQYIVMLGESRWGLACDQLHGTQTLLSTDIQWREQAGKRPWLAGMVKEKMCALIHVSEMITMLNQGWDVKALTHD